MKASTSSRRRFWSRLRPAAHTVGQKVMALVRVLPIPQVAKDQTVTAIYRLMGPLFPGLPQVAAWRRARGANARGVPVAALSGNQIEHALATVAFVATERPRVSIIVPCYGKLDFTLSCLESIARHRPNLAFEVIVIEDASGEPQIQRLAALQGIQFVQNLENLGFLRTCNKAAQMARGTFLYFLNNDTRVTEGWLDAMVTLFDTRPDCGLVGSKLVYPDGVLQEAGGIIWRDATGWNFGREDDARKPEYNYVREVDYCSGASIMLRRELFSRLGGFDDRFAPAYFEDSDLAFAVREAGYRVLFQPASSVIHYEGVTSGTDPTLGVKAYQVKNRGKFQEKWKVRLVQQGVPGTNVWRRRDAAARTWGLVVADKTSCLLHGDVLSEIMSGSGLKVTFLPMDLVHATSAMQDLQQLGIECLYHPYVSSVREYLREFGSEFRVVLLNPVAYLRETYEAIRANCPNATLVFNPGGLGVLSAGSSKSIPDSVPVPRANLSDNTHVMDRSDLILVAKATDWKHSVSDPDDSRFWEIPPIDGEQSIQYAQRLLNQLLGPSESDSPARQVPGQPGAN